jgi:hypothetical protein
VNYRTELARRITAAEREHTVRAEQMWRALDVNTAVHVRGIAEGLAMARNFQLELAAEERGDDVKPDVMDSVMHSVWLHGKWRWLTSKMGAEEREVAADAVQRYSTWLNRQDEELASEVLDLRWWRDA